MKVIKRNGRSVIFNPSKVTARLRARKGDLNVDVDEMAIKVISQMADGMTTTEVDTLCVELATSMVVLHPDYSKLASGLFVTQMRKGTPDTFTEAVRLIQYSTGVLSDEFVNFVKQNARELNKTIDQEKDFNHSIFGLRTLEKSYLLKDEDGNIIERPQYMWMRTAIEVSGFDLNLAIETYKAMSSGYYTHATPTLFNSGTKLAQLSSCFLLGNKGDNIDGLADTMKDTMRISKLSGGLGIHIHDVRAKGSHIAGTNGKSDGIVPMLKTYNEIARWINQGGKRKGSIAFYIEPWHSDIFEYLDLKKNHGKEEMRARDLFYAVWTNDLFMERVKNDEDWSLFCPNVLKKNGFVLQELVGDRFKANYETAEDLKLATRVVKARDLWEKILVSQIETGTPYIGYKDTVNKANNQQHYGVIKSSNLCIEINEYSDENEQAVCNLASVALPMFVVHDKLKKHHSNMKFDFNKFREIVHLAVRNLDNVIDANYYPTKETKSSNSKHRPVGLGVQGLADVFAKFKIAFDSEEARVLNKKIFEHMYFYALEESNKLAKEKGCYSTFAGSPASQGRLQYDMYAEMGANIDLDLSLDWTDLKNRIMHDGGLRNSLLIALMPTASTSQILGNNEAFEPFNSNLYTRRVLSGTYVVINEHLVSDLEEIGLWNKSIRNGLIRDNGSVMNLNIPTEIKMRYKTAYEMSMKSVIDLASDRQKFVCQAQSMNLFVDSPDFNKLSSMHMYGWNSKLKTGIYYLRSKAAADATKFTLEEEPEDEKITPEEEFKAMVERSRLASENGDDCEMCGS